MAEKRTILAASRARHEAWRGGAAAAALAVLPHDKYFALGAMKGRGRKSGGFRPPASLARSRKEGGGMSHMTCALPRGEAGSSRGPLPRPLPNGVRNPPASRKRRGIRSSGAEKKVVSRARKERGQTFANRSLRPPDNLSHPWQGAREGARRAHGVLMGSSIISAE